MTWLPSSSATIVSVAAMTVTQATGVAEVADMELWERHYSGGLSAG